MSIMSDIQISQLVNTKEITIDPYFELFQSPNCYHCHLGLNFKRINPAYIKSGVNIDPLVQLPDDFYLDFIATDYYDIKPGEFLLGEVFEYLGTSDNYVIKLLNSSSIARLGISQAALGMINAGCGMFNPVKITLELINNSPVSIRLRPTIFDKNQHILWGTEVLKIVVEKMDTKPSIPYDNWKFGVYSNDKKVSGSKMAGRFNDGNLFLSKDSHHLKNK